MRPRFHLAFPVDNLSQARHFYHHILGCALGRSSDQWIDFNFFGHQIVAHLSREPQQEETNLVDGHQVPKRHFGLLLTKEQWCQMRERLEQHEVDFIIAPHIRFEGQPGEQATFFVTDPAGNGLEFKYFADESMIFAK
ncbi:VOC family protein [Pleionea sp. CnH1-48]|uniref:VOC family protein n=1 Tax=Pleionea sp. CnH1-48 TaxID=2954494 RepID=UPI002097FADA|nr:VOC family protein [Pleionea sp. CnH1-48]MCO7224193.1 VOC family protein [Pleionea sp. CnH1-48]